MVAAYKVTLILGLISTELLALLDSSGTSAHFGGNGGPDATGVPFFPIWWSQTGVQEVEGRRSMLFLQMTVVTAIFFAVDVVNKYDERLFDRMSERYTLVVGLAGAFLFALMGIVNTNIGVGRVVHGVSATLAGVCFVAYLILATDRRNWRRRWTIFSLFMFLLCIENLKKIAGWHPATAASASPLAIQLFRLSSLAQWAQLVAFALLS
jgi:hypothetical protein